MGSRLNLAGRLVVLGVDVGVGRTMVRPPSSCGAGLRQLAARASPCGGALLRAASGLELCKEPVASFAAEMRTTTDAVLRSLARVQIVTSI